MDELNALIGRAARLEGRYCFLEAAACKIRLGKSKRRARRRR